MERGDYESAIRSFERARAQMRPYSSQVLSMVSLVGLLMGIPHCVETVCDPRHRYLDGNLVISTSQ